MAIKHSITLSTTEPNNEVGVIKIRQADEQTQTLEVQITENGVPKSYQGLAVYFCAKLGQTAGLGIIEQKLKLEEMTDPANGKLEYTMRAEDWQILGRQRGYFSFRKMKDEHEFVEQFTTRDFTFDVIKSVYSDGIKEVKKDGSTYVWTIEELMRLFKEYVESGKTDWEEFVEQNRELLEGVDPGGQLLSELIRTRKPAGATVPYNDVPERLDKQIGLNSDFREFEANESFMKRVFNEQSERGVNVKWFGVKGDGVTDDTLAFKTLLTKGFPEIFLPDGKYLIDVGVEIPDNTKIAFSENAFIKLIPNGLENYRILNIANVENVTLVRPKIIGDKDQHLGTSGEWGHGINLVNAKNVKIIEPVIENCWGDGIYIGGTGYENRCQNIRITNPSVNNCRRNGISVVNVEGLYMSESHISNISGTNPQSGIDFEPNNPNETLKDIRIGKVYTKNCTNESIAFPLRLMSSTEYNQNSLVDIVIDEVFSDGDGSAMLAIISRKLIGEKIRGNITINKLRVINAKKRALYSDNWNSNSPKIVINEIQSINHNRIQADTLKEKAAILLESTISGEKQGNIVIEKLDIRSDSEKSGGLYITAPSGTDVAVKKYYYDSPNVKNIDTFKPEEVLYIYGAGSRAISYEKKYYALMENIGNEGTYIGMDIGTKIGTSIRLPNSQKNLGAVINFHAMVNDAGANSYPTIRLSADADKITGASIGVITDPSKTIRLRGEGASMTIESMLGSWRITKLTGTLEVT